MNHKFLPAALLLAVLPLIVLAEDPAPAATPAPAAAAPAPDLAAAPVVAPETPATDMPAAADTMSAPNPLGDSPTPPTGKRVCNMKGKGMMPGQGMGMGPGMGPGMGKPCGCPGHQGCSCGHGGGHGAMHQDVAQRLDLIEARLAKIEAMLESLMRR